MKIAALYDLFLKNPSVQTDTRQLKEGDLFFALKGDNFNGNQFAQQALDQGASYAVIDEEEYRTSDRMLLVDDVLTTLQELAKFHRLRSKARILAITGTNGKTTTKELVAAVLSEQFEVVATKGNLNNHIGVPLTLLTIKPTTDIAIIEMGANHIGEIASYCEWALPEIGVITNIGNAHLEGFGSIDGVQQAKGELYSAVAVSKGTLIYWTGAPRLLEMLPNGVDTLSYGSSDGAQVEGSVIQHEMLHFDVKSPSALAGAYATKLVGSYNLPNALCAIAVGCFFQVDSDLIRKALAQYTPENSRSQLIKKGTSTIIMDAYNANPSSMQLAIDNIANASSSKKVVFLGCMKELGSESLIEHQKLVAQLEARGISEVYLVGEEYEGVNGRYPLFKDSQSLHDHLEGECFDGALILIKGSRGAKMEVVLSAL